MFFVIGLKSQNLNVFYNQSLEAYAKKDYQKYIALSLEALKINPTQPTILQNLASGYALTNEKEAAAEILNRLLTWNTQINYRGNTDLKALLADANYMGMLDETKSKYNTLAIGSMAYANLSGTFHLEDLVKAGPFFFFTDVHSGNVYRYSINGKKASKFITLPLSAMAVTEGVENTTIWVSSAVVPQYIKGTVANVSPMLYEINIATGQVLNSILLPKEAVVGSMVKAENGMLYASDSSRPQIFVINTLQKRLVKTIMIPEAKNLQGIDLNFTGDKLYVADYLKGIFILDPVQERIQAWLSDDKYLLKGIDGIRFIDRRNLVAIQNNSTPKRVIKIMHIDGRVQSIKLLDNKLPINGEPTNGFYDPQEGFYYIANSQWPFYDKDNKALYDKWETQQIRLIPVENLKR